jgi:hypothetical protein
MVEKREEKKRHFVYHPEDPRYVSGPLKELLVSSTNEVTNVEPPTDLLAELTIRVMKLESALEELRISNYDNRKTTVIVNSIQSAPKQ